VKSPQKVFNYSRHWPNLQNLIPSLHSTFLINLKPTRSRASCYKDLILIKMLAAAITSSDGFSSDVWFMTTRKNGLLLKADMIGVFTPCIMLAYGSPWPEESDKRPRAASVSCGVYLTVSATVRIFRRRCCAGSPVLWSSGAGFSTFLRFISALQPSAGLALKASMVPIEGPVWREVLLARWYGWYWLGELACRVGWEPPDACSSESDSILAGMISVSSMSVEGSSSLVAFSFPLIDFSTYVCNLVSFFSQNPVVRKTVVVRGRVNDASGNTDWFFCPCHGYSYFGTRLCPYCRCSRLVARTSSLFDRLTALMRMAVVSNHQWWCGSCRFGTFGGISAAKHLLSKFCAAATSITSSARKLDIIDLHCTKP